MTATSHFSSRAAAYGTNRKAPDQVRKSRRVGAEITRRIVLPVHADKERQGFRPFFGAGPASSIKGESRQRHRRVAPRQILEGLFDDDCRPGAVRRRGQIEK